ncbi:hypothetical protein CHARACLAT_033572, partial [Characodon lateralis]|nr:hypothetical protein [Characodon lateralis]
PRAPGSWSHPERRSRFPAATQPQNCSNVLGCRRHKTSTMSLHTLSLRALLFLGLWHSGRRSLASAPELQEQPSKMGKYHAADMNCNLVVLVIIRSDLKGKSEFSGPVLHLVRQV